MEAAARRYDRDRAKREWSRSSSPVAHAQKKQVWKVPVSDKASERRSRSGPGHEDAEGDMCRTQGANNQVETSPIGDPYDGAKSEARRKSSGSNDMKKPWEMSGNKIKAPQFMRSKSVGKSSANSEVKTPKPEMKRNVSPKVASAVSSDTMLSPWETAPQTRPGDDVTDMAEWGDVDLEPAPPRAGMGVSGGGNRDRRSRPERRSKSSPFRASSQGAWLKNHLEQLSEFQYWLANKLCDLKTHLDEDGEEPRGARQAMGRKEADETGDESQDAATGSDDSSCSVVDFLIRRSSPSRGKTGDDKSNAWKRLNAKEAPYSKMRKALRDFEGACESSVSATGKLSTSGGAKSGPSSHGPHDGLKSKDKLVVGDNVFTHALCAVVLVFLLVQILTIMSIYYFFKQS